MAAAAPTYDLVMLLDPQAEDAARAKLIADARAAIEAEGELLRHDDWGTRTLAYPIQRKAVAEYHLMQFHAGKPELLSSLDRSLRIADDILRFRIVKLKPGVPEAPDMKGTAAVSAVAAQTPAMQTPAEGGAETAETASTAADAGARADAPAPATDQADAAAQAPAEQPRGDADAAGADEADAQDAAQAAASDGEEAGRAQTP